MSGLLRFRFHFPGENPDIPLDTPFIVLFSLPVESGIIIYRKRKKGGTMNFVSITISFRSSIILIASFAMPALMSLTWAEPASTTKFTNIGSIANTRHNLTQQPIGAGAGWMSLSRNDYGEVCVYCHTPHGSQTLQQMPLWNRTIKATTYTTYDQLNLHTDRRFRAGQPSLTCLSVRWPVASIRSSPGSGIIRPARQPSRTCLSDTYGWSGGACIADMAQIIPTLGNYGECIFAIRHRAISEPAPRF